MEGVKGVGAREKRAWGGKREPAIGGNYAILCKFLPVNETLQVSKAIRMAPQFMLISSAGSKVKRCFQHKLSRHCYGF